MKSVCFFFSIRTNRNKENEIKSSKIVLQQVFSQEIIEPFTCSSAD